MVVAVSERIDEDNELAPDRADAVASDTLSCP
jgi:hypothetical protein